MFNLFEFSPVGDAHDFGKKIGCKNGTSEYSISNDSK